MKPYLFLGSIFAQLAFGSLVEFSGVPKNLSASGQTVKIYPSAVVAEEDPISLTGYGIRWKYVTIIKTNIYAAAQYIDEGLAFDTAAPLTTIADSKNEVMQMTFLRPVTAKEIENAMKLSLKNNGIDVTKPEFVAVFSKFDFNMNVGDTMTVIGQQNPEGETITIEVLGKVIESK